MKNTHKLIPLLLVALAVNTAGNSVNAKTLPLNQPAAALQTKIPEAKKELYTVTSISFSGLKSLNEEELITSMPIKVSDRIAIPGMELSGALQYLWQLRVFSDIQV